MNIHFNKNMDLLMLTLPPAAEVGPPLGPAVVLAEAKKAGFKCGHIDLNQVFYKKFAHINEIYEWLTIDSYGGANSSIIKKNINKFAQEWVSKVVELNPRWVGISIFSYRCKLFLDLFLSNLKKVDHNIKIVLGGAGVDKLMVEKFKSEKFVDAIVYGEGENAIVNILSGNLNFHGVNGNEPLEIEDLDLVSFADYSDLNILDYSTLRTNNGKKNISVKPNIVSIETSRGCVRKCRFCDIPNLKPGFRFRSAESIIKEIKILKEKHDISLILFADNLVNGSLKNLRNLCNHLKDFRTTLPNKSIQWTGNFIIRAADVFVENDFRLLAESGAAVLSLGVESGSEKVRREMNKPILDKDIDFTLQQSVFHKIGVIVLLVVGYPTETRSDFQLTLEMIERNKDILSLAINKINCSWKVGINGHESELGLYPDRHGVKFDQFGQWYSQSVNPLVSAKRYFELTALTKHLEISMRYKFSNQHINSIIKNYHVSISDLTKSEDELTEIYLQSLNGGNSLTNQI